MNAYEKFIQKYKNQIIEASIYVEKHHIIPRYMGGSNKKDNIIILTYRQHILAHLLLYRLHNNLEDLCAYNLMKGLCSSRKSEISKMIGEKHKISGHIQRLGLKNKETNWINEIKTPESLSSGGKAAGKIAKETGQIQRCRTDEGSYLGGVIAGNLAKERGQIQQLSKYRGTYVLIMPDGEEFLHTFQAAEYMNLPAATVNSRCKQGNLGFGRRKKSKNEMGMYGVLNG